MNKKDYQSTIDAIKHKGNNNPKTELQKEISKTLSNAGIFHSDNDVLMIIAVTKQFNKSGYELGFLEVTKFLTNDKNKKIIEKDGLTKTIEAMANMRLGTIRKSKKPSRNEKCHCGSGLKYKKCCYAKDQKH